VQHFFTCDLSYGYGSSSGVSINEKSIKGKYVGKFEDVDVFESSLSALGKNDYSGGITLPVRGIIVGEGTYTKFAESEWIEALMQYEYGHILQSLIVRLKAYYSVIGPESLLSATVDGVLGHSHNTFWTETWANHLSKGYFGSMWNHFNGHYVAKNISKINLVRLLRLK
jgi:hypothetical protein